MMMMTPTARPLCRARQCARALLIAGVLAPAMLFAQDPTAQSPPETQEHIDGPTYARVAIGFTQIYDDNVFYVSNSEHPTSDLVSRFGPTFEVGRHSRRLELTARYGMAAERYFNRTDLNRDLAYQDGGFEIHYNFTPRRILTVVGQYLDTHTPQDLNLTSGIARGRARAERLMVHGGIAQDLSRITRLTAEAEAANDTFAETNTTLTQKAHLGLARQSSLRSIYRLDARARYITFNFLLQNEFGQSYRDRGAQNAQILTGGWTYAFTPLTSVDIDAGPRLAAGEWSAELSGTVRRRTQKGELSAGYVQTQDTLIGEPGFVDVRRVNVALSVTPVRPLTLSAMPSFARTNWHGKPTDVRELDVDIVIRVLRRLLVTASARVADQSGQRDGVEDPLETRRLWVATTLTLP
jgi:hypothetical protein